MERDGRLLELIQERGGASVVELSEALGVSPPTIRRDLRRLVAKDLVVRTHGGAMRRSAVSIPYAEENGKADPVKDRIGRAAADSIEDGETVAISSGTTTLAVARHLVDRGNLTVITNALDIAQVVIDRPGIELIVLGGVARPRMHSLLGHLTDLTINELRADKFVMGIAAFDVGRGLTNDYMPEVLIDRALARISNQVIVVADSSKSGRVEPAHVFNMSEVDTLVTDTSLPQGQREAIEAAGVELVIV